MTKRIFNLEGNNIEVFQFKTIPHKMKLFRIQELDTLLREEQVLRREPTKGWFTPKKDVLYECGNYVLRMTKNPKREEASEIQRVKYEYINSYYENDPVFINGSLITLSPENNTTNKRINLTMDAYLAYLLDNKMFDSPFLQEENLERVKDIFKISDKPIMELSVEELRKVYESQLIEYDYDEKMEYVQSTSKVLKKLR